jgi:hypothetical protein
MAFADTAYRTVREGYAPFQITLAEACEAGDLLGYSDGWKLADANNGPIIAVCFAGTAGAIGDVITAFRIGVIEGFTGGTAGNALYASDTAGSYGESAGTAPQPVGVMVSATMGLVDLRSYSAATLSWEDVTASAAELNILDGATVTNDELNTLDGAVADVEFSVGAEDGNAIVVTCQFKDANGDDCVGHMAAMAYLSDADDGDGVTATGPDGTIAVVTDGSISEIVADKVFLITSEDDGDFAVSIGEAGAATWYLTVILPNGKLAVSDAITFAG